MAEQIGQRLKKRIHRMKILMRTDQKRKTSAARR